MNQGTKKIKADRMRHSFFLLIVIALFLPIVLNTGASSQEKALDWPRVANLKPELKVLILVESGQGLTLQDIATLGEMGWVPADRDPALLIGLRRAIFSTKLKNWVNRRGLPGHLNGKLLDRFIMNGIFRAGFKVEKEGYQGPLMLEMTIPRDSFGKWLLSSENIIRPQTPNKTYTDPGGNRWLRVDYPELRYGQTIKLFSAFRYLVDMSVLLHHDLMLVDQFQHGPIPEEIQPFLDSGYKIDARLPQAVAWALQGKSGPPNMLSEYRRLNKFLKGAVAYDVKKREQYFGGKAVYSDLDEMYQEIEVTLSRRLGACPDTSLLECAFLRARGIPCRIEGRFGHFFSVVYVPGRGWMSTSVTPTGIPLFVAPGPDHVPYQKWRPEIPLKTILLVAPIRIETVED